jgi:hypothetical protein
VTSPLHCVLHTPVFHPQFVLEAVRPGCRRDDLFRLVKEIRLVDKLMEPVRIIRREYIGIDDSGHSQTGEAAYTFKSDPHKKS